METSAVALPAPAPALAAARRRATLCVLGAGFSFAVAAALIKTTAAENIPVTELVVFRSVVISLVMAGLLQRQGGVMAALRTRRPLGHLVRTLFGFIAMTTSFVGYVRLPRDAGHQITAGG